MKYYILAGAVIVAGAVATVIAHNSAFDSSNAKRYAVEPETKVRPAYFEDMKFKPADAVEMRAPASDKKK